MRRTHSTSSTRTRTTSQTRTRTTRRRRTSSRTGSTTKKMFASPSKGIFRKRRSHISYAIRSLTISTASSEALQCKRHNRTHLFILTMIHRWLRYYRAKCSVRAIRARKAASSATGSVRIGRPSATFACPRMRASGLRGRQMTEKTCRPRSRKSGMIRKIP